MHDCCFSHILSASQPTPCRITDTSLRNQTGSCRITWDDRSRDPPTNPTQRSLTLGYQIQSSKQFPFSVWHTFQCTVSHPRCLRQRTIWHWVFDICFLPRYQFSSYRIPARWTTTLRRVFWKLWNWSIPHLRTLLRRNPARPIIVTLRCQRTRRSHRLPTAPAAYRIEQQSFNFRNRIPWLCVTGYLRY